MANNATVSATDVAAHILARYGRLDGYTLQKLTYYAQAWTLAWTGRPLFAEPIEAWQQGPVVRELWYQHSRQRTVAAVTGHPERLGRRQLADVDAVCDYYGQFTGEELSRMTHDERPWLDARGDLSPAARSQAEVSRSSMRSFYTAARAEGRPGPRRPHHVDEFTVEAVMREVDIQVPRWQPTLDWLADK